ncbi:MAG: hypothetical protein V5A23_05955 [Halobacteriales archaeon]
MASILWLAAAASKGVILVAGGAIIYYTARAARRTGNLELWLLTAGLLFTGAGVLLAGWLPTLGQVGRETGVALTSALSAAGLVIVVYSIFVGEPVPTH